MTYMSRGQNAICMANVGIYQKHTKKLDSWSKLSFQTIIPNCHSKQSFQTIIPNYNFGILLRFNEHFRTFIFL